MPLQGVATALRDATAPERALDRHFRGNDLVLVRLALPRGGRCWRRWVRRFPRGGIAFGRLFGWLPRGGIGHGALFGASAAGE